ncbi:MAG: hypothetical protein ACT4NL_13910 [Pseudomarimonas sp.]
MTPFEVESFKSHGPYLPVPITGGLETHRAKLDRGRTNVSFVFDGDRLDYIQVWYFEGRQYRRARAATLEIFDLFAGRFGGASIPGIKVNGTDQLQRDDLEVMLDRVLGTSAELGSRMAKEGKGYGIFQFNIVPATQPSASKLTGQFGYSTRHDTYYVFLFQDDKSKPDRRVQANIQVEAP